MIKNNRYQYDKIKVFKRGMIMGLTKSLTNLRFIKHTYEGPKISTNDLIIDKAKTYGLELDYNDSGWPGEKFIFTKARKITAEQTKFGKVWLKQHFFKLDGSPRSGKNTEYVSENVLRIAKSATRFEFIGVLGVGNSYWDICQVLPIYRTYNHKGEYFDYAPIHWGQPIVMEG